MNDHSERLEELAEQWESILDGFGIDKTAREICQLNRCPELENELASTLQALRFLRRQQRISQRSNDRSQRSRSNRAS